MIPAPNEHDGAFRKFDPLSVTLRLVLPRAAELGLTLASAGAGEFATVMVRTGGLGSVFPALSVTVNVTEYLPGFANVTVPGLASELVLGEPPRKTQEYPVMDPLGALPVP